MNAMCELLFILSIVLLAAASAACVYSLHADSGWFHAHARRLFYLSAAPFLAAGLIRYYPFGLRDFINIVSTIWGHFYVLAFFLYLLLAYLDLSRWKAHWRPIGAVALPFITVVCALSLPFMGSARSIQVGFANHLLPFHVILAVVGELFFFFSFAGSLLGLYLERRLKRKTSLRLTGNLPSLETIDHFNTWSVTRAVFFLTAGLVMGIALVWINYRTLFLFSLKETMMYLSWVFIVIILLLRRDGRLGMGRVNAVNVLLFAAVIAMYVASNVIMNTGFHSFR